MLMKIPLRSRLFLSPWFVLAVGWSYQRSVDPVAPILTVRVGSIRATPSAPRSIKYVRLVRRSCFFFKSELERTRANVEECGYARKSIRRVTNTHCHVDRATADRKFRELGADASEKGTRVTD